MATEHAGLTNGTSYTHQGYEQNAYAYASNNASSQQSTSTPSATTSAPQQPEISKDEVGWYFVEQYYTTLSRSPEKLYLFYNKRSQFVSGQETDKVAVCVGQRAINDKIKELDFHDCKVRVTNVDSQASDSHIVIQVIGEISNKSQPHKKFTQTFVLATQTNGYFVLNDIFRYLIEEEDEAETEAAAPAEEVQQVSGTESSEPAQAEAEPKTLTSSSDPVKVEEAAKVVDKELEEKVVKPAEEAPTTNGNHVAEEKAQTVEETPAPVKDAKAEPVAESKPAAVEEEKLEQETPKDPEPTPAMSPKKAAPAQPAQAPKPAAPAAPKTWAQLASARSAVAMPSAPASAAPATSAATKAAPAAAKAATPAPSSSSTTPSAPAAAAAPSASSTQRQDASGSDSQDEWTAVGHNRQQSRQVNAPQPDQPQHRGYIKNVQDNVNAEELRSILQKFGDILYLDIARQKVCPIARPRFVVPSC
jgi:hypothetical protein